MDEHRNTVRLDRDMALLLFEMLYRAGPTGAVRPLDSAEQRVLWEVEGQLEKQLVELFSDRYRELLDEARQRLREPAATEVPKARAVIVFVDVDDTLVRSAGSKRIPMTTMIERVRELAATGARLYCWSTAGAEYAHRSAVELDIASCFVDFLSKPEVVIDDQALGDWRVRTLHPNEATSMTAAEILSVGPAHRMV